MKKEGLSLREIQLSMLDILKFFHELCEEHGLTYYLAYGTLIGAIRHKGFIPWDDDADIWMPREDYEKLKQVFEKEGWFIGPYKLCLRANTEKYEFYLPRISDTRYSYMATGSKNNIGDMGTFIDIYPMDTFEEGKQADRVRDKIANINHLFRFYADFRNSNSMINTIIKAPIYAILRLVYGKGYEKRVDARIDDIIAKISKKDGSRMGLLGWHLVTRRSYDASMLKERVLVDFEDAKFWAPKEYDKILTETYGKYMELPPEKDRQPYHPYTIIKKEN